MNRRRCFAILLPLMMLATACDRSKFCSPFRAAYGWAVRVAYPVLDVVAGLDPRIAAIYGPSKTSLEVAAGLIDSLCRTGTDDTTLLEAVDRGAGDIADLARLYGETVHSRDPRAADEWHAVIIDMQQLRADVAKARRR